MENDEDQTVGYETSRDVGMVETYDNPDETIPMEDIETVINFLQSVRTASSMEEEDYNETDVNRRMKRRCVENKETPQPQVMWDIENPTWGLQQCLEKGMTPYEVRESREWNRFSIMWYDRAYHNKYVRDGWHWESSWGEFEVTAVTNPVITFGNKSAEAFKNLLVTTKGMLEWLGYYHVHLKRSKLMFDTTMDSNVAFRLDKMVLYADKILELFCDEHADTVQVQQWLFNKLQSKLLKIYQSGIVKNQKAKDMLVSLLEQMENKNNYAKYVFNDYKVAIVLEPWTE